MVISYFAIFTKQKLQNISGNHACTYWQKLAADISRLVKLGGSR